MEEEIDFEGLEFEVLDIKKILMTDKVPIFIFA